MESEARVSAALDGAHQQAEVAAQLEHELLRVSADSGATRHSMVVERLGAVEARAKLAIEGIATVGLELSDVSSAVEDR